MKEITRVALLNLLNNPNREVDFNEIIHIMMLDQMLKGEQEPSASPFIGQALVESKKEDSK